ncbi:MAG: HAMP domain-containing histidine kinase [Opitutaceae bacterium]|nr:HAMP domain-containing histidine kinase [Cytophagales bacterium]
MNIYDNKAVLKFLIVIVAIALAGLSLWYTNVLVNNLAQREQRLIDLYAKGLKTLVSENTSDNLSFLFNEIIETNDFIPVILTDDKRQIINTKNIYINPDWDVQKKDKFFKSQLFELQNSHAPIKLEIAPGIVNYIYYGDSKLLNQLKYYPYIQLGVIALFAFLTYLLFSYTRNAEQNRVWAGMAKETAHQLGTPISSLMAWVELFKSDVLLKDHFAIPELEKDIKRLDTVTARFSNIGSKPLLKEEIIEDVIQESVSYLQLRISNRVKISMHSELTPQTTVMINKPLFEWVIENLCKNAVDAMAGSGKLDIFLQQDNLKRILIDVQDTGKGIAKNKIKEVFRPGFTTKKRGWGLGLTLAKRIIESYHKGQIFVKTSEIDKGTTFRMVL